MSLDTNITTGQEQEKLVVTAEQALQVINELNRKANGNRKPVREYFESLPEQLRKSLLRNREYRWIKTAVYGFGG